MLGVEWSGPDCSEGGNVFEGRRQDLTPETRNELPGSFVELSVGVTHYELRGDTDGESVVLIHGNAAPYVTWDNTIEEDLLVPFGDTWNYLDTGVDPGATWTDAGFDDSAWLAGAGELGYGDSQATEIGYGGDSANKHITSWFRRTFSVTNAAEITAASLRMRWDERLQLVLAQQDRALSCTQKWAVYPSDGFDANELIAKTEKMVALPSPEA